MACGSMGPVVVLWFADWVWIQASWSDIMVCALAMDPGVLDSYYGLWTGLWIQRSWSGIMVCGLAVDPGVLELYNGLRTGYGSRDPGVV